jgi:dTDP-4-dehydrorhamnose reductase
MGDRRPIVVAGRAGQLACGLVETATAAGIPLLARGRPEFDLENADAAERVAAEINPRAIINAAAYTAVDQAESEPARAFAVNRDGAARLAAAAARHGIPFLHMSTDYVFDGLKGAPYNEEDAPAPANVYGQSKLEGEQAVRQNNPAAVIVRTSGVYSPWGQNFVKTMLGLAETRDVVKVVNDQMLTPTSALDLARAMLTVAEGTAEGEHHAGIYHLAGDGAVTWFDFATEIFAGAARRGWRVPKIEPIASADFARAAKRPPNSALDCRKAERTFGVRLPPWRESVDACLERLLAAPSRESARC